ncbi:MAG: glycosyltransferase [Marinicellaceae bacterium]
MKVDAVKHILFLVGPALGHVSRCLTIARELNKISIHKITFICVTPGYGEKLIKSEYPIINIKYKERGDCIFADGVEKVISELKPDLVCVDLTPMKWLTLVRFHQTKTLYITNYFLTNVCQYQTIQQIRFNDQKNEINLIRKSRGLAKLTNIKDLYDLDSVLLCDPIQFVNDKQKLNQKYHVVGPCFWEPEIEMPIELEPLNDILFVSLGSTGRMPIPNRIIDEIAIELNIKNVVWLGANLKKMQPRANYTNHYYSWLPASKLIKKSKFVISQGGSGSTYQALSYGVPCGVWPTHKNQEILGSIIEKKTYGLLLHNSVDVKEKLHTLYETFKSNCIQLSKSISSTNSPFYSAKLIIKFIDRGM